MHVRVASARGGRAAVQHPALSTLLACLSYTLSFELRSHVGLLQVRVAFARGGETASLRQLSGGQKTLVALALIFAIQVCVRILCV